ncbi:MAG: prepilin-type N-terminal cleavage/methylation domain-containing protein [bacterium]
MENKAFTLIELIVVISIVALMTALILPNYRHGDNQLAIERAAHKISQDLRRTQEFAISAKDFNGTAPKGYGIYFDLNYPDKYIMFADINGDKIYSGEPDEKVEEIILEGNIALDIVSSMTIFFAPPDPTITFTPDVAIATINIKAEGTDELVNEYWYNYKGLVQGKLDPRADCDLDIQRADCPNSFPALASDPSIVYDWNGWSIDFIRSKIFEKSTTQVITHLQKTIQVNKAGLIAVE